MVNGRKIEVAKRRWAGGNRPVRCVQDMETGQTSSRAKSRRRRRSRKVLGARVLSEEAWKAVSRTLELSGRELEIVRGVFEDRTEFAIANDLKISPHTVHTHVQRLHRKLRVANRVQLLLRVMDEFHGLMVSPGAGLPPFCANWESGNCPLDRTKK